MSDEISTSSELFPTSINCGRSRDSVLGASDRESFEDDSDKSSGYDSDHQAEHKSDHDADESSNHSLEQALDSEDSRVLSSSSPMQPTADPSLSSDDLDVSIKQEPSSSPQLRQTSDRQSIPTAPPVNKHRSLHPAELHKTLQGDWPQMPMTHKRKHQPQFDVDDSFDMSVSTAKRTRTSKKPCSNPAVSHKPIEVVDLSRSDDVGQSSDAGKLPKVSTAFNTILPPRWAAGPLQSLPKPVKGTKL